ncbi:hypothetical protein BDA96_10G106500 [Sorghum bicolor]|uniref:SHSP domain-containing protein n=1 Tax=Sorghum bicolor TaxID=4558 RepID=A0A921Q362_SORBI|nr:hypothetical protein BDA96_10G106500 [Sorghum bicolor]
MASAVASQVALPKPVFLMDILASPSASARPLFSTGDAPPRSSSDGVKDTDGVKDSTGEDAAAADRRPERVPKLFTGDVLDLFPEAAIRDLLLALAEDGGGAASMTGFSPRGSSWVSKDDADAVQLKVAMPGLGKEHVKMRVEKDTLVIKGEGDKDSEGDDKKDPAGYICRIDLPSHAFKVDQIKAEMKNGVLMVTVPKIKDGERKDVFEIKVE